MPSKAKLKIAIILGTRPEIIKMSPVIRAGQKHNVSFFILHTNQHYSENLDKIFFKELHLPYPKYNLGVGAASHGEMTGKMLLGIEKVLVKERPSIVLVQGDTNSVLAGALAAAKLHIPVGHIEAGLRSYDNTMPEELNRKLVDHLSGLLFAPTALAAANLKKEGIVGKKVQVVGNTIADAVNQNLKIAKEKSRVLKTLGLAPKKYILATAHRQENTDHRLRLLSLMTGLGQAAEKLTMPVIYPIHPRTKKMMEKFNLNTPKGVKVIPPVGFLDFLALEHNAKIILTDSGGIQEEACILRVPCLTLRDSTERPETIEVGANLLVGVNPKKILDAASLILNKKPKWKSPFGSGNSGEKIIKILTNNF